MSSFLNNKLIRLGVLTELIYLFFYLLEPLEKYLGIFTLTQTTAVMRPFTITLLYLGCIAYYFACKQVRPDKKDYKIILIFLAIFSATNLFILPITSTDLYLYVAYGRVAISGFLNPYLVPYTALTADAFYPVLGQLFWSGLPTVYGPLFIMISNALTFLGSNNFLLTLILFKILMTAANFFSALLIYKITNSEKALLLYAWNPLVIFEFTINGHNDILQILLLLTACFFILKKINIANFAIAYTLILLTVFIKYITAIFLPVIFLYYIFNTQGVLKKVYIFMLAGLIFATVALGLYAPFWDKLIPENFIKYVSGYYHGHLFFSSLLIMLSALVLYKIFPLVYVIYASVIGKVVFVVSYLGILIFIFLKRNKIKSVELFGVMTFLTAIFYLTFFKWFMPWYLVMLIVLMIIYATLAKKNYTPAILALSILGISYYFMLF